MGKVKTSIARLSQNRLNLIKKRFQQVNENIDEFISLVPLLSDDQGFNIFLKALDSQIKKINEIKDIASRIKPPKKVSIQPIFMPSAPQPEHTEVPLFTFPTASPFSFGTTSETKPVWSSPRLKK